MHGQMGDFDSKSTAERQGLVDSRRLLYTECGIEHKQKRLGVGEVGPSGT